MAERLAGRGGLLHVSGTTSALNAALNGLLYTPAPGVIGSALFNAYLLDSAGALAWASLTLTVTPA